MNTRYRRAGGYSASLTYRLPDAEQAARRERLKHRQRGTSVWSMVLPVVLFYTILHWL